MQCGHCRMRGGCSSLGRAKRIEKNMRSASSHCEQRSAACAGLQHPDVHPATDEDPSFGDSSANVRDGSRAVTGVNDGPKPQLPAAPRARRSAWLPTRSDQRVQRRPRSSRPGREGDSHQGGPPEDSMAKENSTVDELAGSAERLLARVRSADGRPIRSRNATPVSVSRGRVIADAAAQAQERRGPLGRGVCPPAIRQISTFPDGWIRGRLHNTSHSPGTPRRLFPRSPCIPAVLPPT